LKLCGGRYVGQDLYQEVFMVLCEMADDKLLKINRIGIIKWAFVTARFINGNKFRTKNQSNPMIEISSNRDDYFLLKLMDEQVEVDPFLNKAELFIKDNNISLFDTTLQDYARKNNISRKKSRIIKTKTINEFKQYANIA